MAKKIKKQESTEIATVTKSRRGFEEPTEKEDYIIPRGLLLQGLSEAVQKEGMKQGLIINSLTRDELPETFIPIFKFTTWIRYNAKKKSDRGYDDNFDLGAVIWKSNDPNDPRVIEESKFGENGDAPLATKHINFFCYFPGHPTPVVVSFKKTSLRTGRELLTMAKMFNSDMFAYRYNLTARLEEKNGNSFYMFKVAPAGKSSAEEYTACEKLYDAFADKPIIVDESHHQDEE
ncbi:MAG: hypothetical protein M0P69_04490 [Bacteroidales bacterium]|nr:hypothetical protein [Bacteroidales bacterium]